MRPCASGQTAKTSCLLAAQVDWQRKTRHPPTLRTYLEHIARGLPFAAYHLSHVPGIFVPDLNCESQLQDKGRHLSRICYCCGGRKFEAISPLLNETSLPMSRGNAGIQPLGSCGRNRLISPKTIEDGLIQCVSGSTRQNHSIPDVRPCNESTNLH